MVLPSLHRIIYILFNININIYGFYYYSVLNYYSYVLDPHSRKSLHSDKDSSPASSEDQDWEQGGEAMADACSSICFSSSDESKDKEITPLLLRTSVMNRSMYSDRDQMNSSCTGAIPKDCSRSLLLNREEHLTLSKSKNIKGKIYDQKTNCCKFNRK